MPEPVKRYPLEEVVFEQLRGLKGFWETIPDRYKAARILELGGLFLADAGLSNSSVAEDFFEVFKDIQPLAVKLENLEGNDKLRANNILHQILINLTKQISDLKEREKNISSFLEHTEIEEKVTQHLENVKNILAELDDPTSIPRACEELKKAQRIDSENQHVNILLDVLEKSLERNHSKE